jgi:chloramphenicol 3-O phosphotransferase
VTTRGADGQRPRVLVLNGGSSSGKTSVALELQAVLDGVWLRLGVDTLLDAAPQSLLLRDGLQVTPDGGVLVGRRFEAVEACWMAGVARMAEVGANVVVEDNFVSGPRGQQRWRAALARVPVGWIGVHCDPAIAAERERRRGDRTAGMAAAQAVAVHGGIGYDFEVDAGAHSPGDTARLIRQHFFGR